MGDGRIQALRVQFDGKLKLEFHGTKITHDAGLIAVREGDEAAEKETQRNTADRALALYTSRSEMIRKWFILYGVGIAALFVTQADTLAKLATGTRWWILAPAFLGVIIQLLLVVSIKYSNLITFKAYAPYESLTLDS